MAETDDTTTRELNVLFIDDEELMRDVARLMFEDIGWKGYIAEDAKKGIDLYTEHNHEIDLVIVDFSMPDMNGVETARALKQINDDAKIVVISGLVCDDQLAELEAGHALGFVSKPFLYEDLLDCIDQNFPDLRRV